MLPQKLDMLLGRVSRLLHLLGALAGALEKLLGFALDFLVQPVEDGEYGSLDGLLGFGVGVDEGLGESALCAAWHWPRLLAKLTYLRVDAHVLKVPGHASKALVEVSALPKWLRDGLQDLLVLLCVRLVDLFGRLDVILQVGYGVFPGLESLGQQTGRLCQTRQLAPCCGLGGGAPTVLGSTS